jgi:hypothetical protein
MSSDVPRARVVRVKVLSMGEVGVGKSCLIKRCVRVLAQLLRCCAAPLPAAAGVRLSTRLSTLDVPCILRCNIDTYTRYCEDKFISRYIPTIGIDYGVKPVRLGDHEVAFRSTPARWSPRAGRHRAGHLLTLKTPHPPHHPHPPTHPCHASSYASTCGTWPVPPTTWRCATSSTRRHRQPCCAMTQPAGPALRRWPPG